MKTSKLVCILLGIFIFLASFSVNVHDVRATTITVNRTFSAKTNDCTILKSDSTYDLARDSLESGGIWQTDLRIGQWNSSGTSYSVYHVAVNLDTSSLPETLTQITEATLSLRVTLNQSVQDFNVTVQSGMPNYPNEPAISTDYNRLLYSGNGGSANTSTITALSTYWNISLNAAGLSWIDLDGTTKFMLRSNNDIDGVEPSGLEYVGFSYAEAGSSYSAKLYVTYETEGYRYIVHGPYFESGSVVNAFVNLTLSIENMASNKTYLNGTDGVADEITFEIEQRGIAFTWNISSAGLNLSRTMCLTDETFEEIYITLPAPEETYELYSFTVNDLAGVTNAYLETLAYVGGTQRIIERAKVSAVGSLGFYMTFGHYYTLRLVCDQGTIIVDDSFQAAVDYSNEILIDPLMFPVTDIGYNLTCSATRINETMIEIVYNDNQQETYWAYVTIDHRATTRTYSTDYTYNETSLLGLLSLSWTSADADTDYRVNVTVLKGTETLTYLFTCPRVWADPNPWAGVFDVFGEWPFPSEWIPALCLTFAITFVFGYVHWVFGAASFLMLASLFTYINWISIDWKFVAAGWFIFFLGIIADAKYGHGTVYDT